MSKENVFAIDDPSTIGWVEDGVTTDGDPIWRWDASGSTGGSGIEEAPEDGSQYGRQNARWTQVVSTGGDGSGKDSRISDTQITNWDTSYGWGDHSQEGYLTSFTEEDPTVPNHVKSITTTDIANWNAGGSGVAGVATFNNRSGNVVLTTEDVAAVWDGSGGGYDDAQIRADLATETQNRIDADNALQTQIDGISDAGNDSRISDTQIINWDASYSWGDHSQEGYLTSGELATETQSRIDGDNALQAQIDSISGDSNDSRISDNQIINWDTAYAWGDHSQAGYLDDTNEADWNAAYSWGDHSAQNYAKKTDIITPSYPVTSVNGKTGAVSLSHGDVGAAASSHSHDYAASNHTHSGYAASNHTHSGYAASNHSHNEYASSSHTHNYAPNSAGNGISISSGQIKMSGSYTGSFTATGDITAYSDKSLKENIMTAPCDVIEQLRGVEFTWKEDGRFGSGVIAQEVEKVLPHLIHDHDDGHKSVNYSGLIGYLIEEVKALKAEVEVLRGNS